jgi:hypothetical protein
VNTDQKKAPPPAKDKVKSERIAQVTSGIVRLCVCAFVVCVCLAVGLRLHLVYVHTVALVQAAAAAANETRTRRSTRAANQDPAQNNDPEVMVRVGEEGGGVIDVCVT